VLLALHIVELKFQVITTKCYKSFAWMRN